MLTVKKYETFLNLLRKGMTVTEASNSIGVHPLSMRNAIINSPEVKAEIDSIISPEQDC